MRHVGLRYMPALDGLRALAVLAVLLYHGDVSWAEGGYFGVDAFFVLSGFLITSLLLTEWSQSGRIDLKAFWSRRARRLLPALLLVLAAVALYAWLFALPIELRQLRRDALSTLGYVANWNQIVSDQSYFEQFAVPSPLRHAWSLGIEEQFYIVFPLLLLLVMRATRGSRVALAGVCTVLAVASIAQMVRLYDASSDPSRVYYGTDTRMHSLLIGALLAVLLSRASWTSSDRAVHAALRWLAPVAAVALGFIWLTTSELDPWQYRGGFAIAGVLVALVIAGVTQAGRPGPLGFVLSIPVVRWIGVISYGLYLWHWPIYVFLSPDRTGLAGTRLLGARLTVTFAVAAASFYLVERPVRFGDWRGWQVRVATPAGAAALVVAVVLATGGNVPPAFESMAVSDVQQPPPPVAAERTYGAVDGDIAAGDVKRDPMRVMLVGDSVAHSLAPGMYRVAEKEGFLFWDVSVPGCSLATDVGERWFDFWRGIEPACMPGWRERWPQQIDVFRPDIVVTLFGGQDAYDRRVDGEVTEFDTPEGDALAQQDLEEAVELLSSRGAHVALLSVPYYRLGWPMEIDLERSPFNDSWVDRYNTMQERVERQRDGQVSILDLNTYIGPDGTWTDTVDGVQVRLFDRVHLSEEGADFVARWLAPQLERIGRDVTSSTAERVRQQSPWRSFSENLRRL
jgi:peptidoglycan/LPS O-acetylase OafA/YrhL/lysophospholipase L1-like esterase